VAAATSFFDRLQATSFFDRLQPYVAEWASAAHEQNVVTEHRLHAAAA
jgi:hypothetical protein